MVGKWLEIEALVERHGIIIACFDNNTNCAHVCRMRYRSVQSIEQQMCAVTTPLKTCINRQTAKKRCRNKWITW